MFPFDKFTSNPNSLPNPSHSSPFTHSLPTKQNPQPQFQPNNNLYSLTSSNPFFSLQSLLNSQNELQPQKKIKSPTPLTPPFPLSQPLQNNALPTDINLQSLSKSTFSLYPNIPDNSQLALTLALQEKMLINNLKTLLMLQNNLSVPQLTKSEENAHQIHVPVPANQNDKTPTNNENLLEPEEKKLNNNDKDAPKIGEGKRKLERETTQNLNDGASVTDSTLSMESNSVQPQGVVNESDGNIDKGIKKKSLGKKKRRSRANKSMTKKIKKRKFTKKEWESEGAESEGFKEFLAKIKQEFGGEEVIDERLLKLLGKFKWNKEQVIDNLKKNKSYYKRYLTGLVGK